MTSKPRPPRPPVLYRAARRRGFSLSRARRVVQTIAAVEAELRGTDAAAGTLWADEITTINRGATPPTRSTTE